MILKDTLFESGATNFSYNNSKLYLRNLSLAHESGTLSGSYLQNELKEFQFDAELKMDPRTFTPFMDKVPDFVSKL